MLKDDGLNLLISLLTGIAFGVAALTEHNLFYAFASGSFLRYVYGVLIHNLTTTKSE